MRLVTVTPSCCECTTYCTSERRNVILELLIADAVTYRMLLVCRVLSFHHFLSDTRRSPEHNALQSISQDNVQRRNSSSYVSRHGKLVTVFLLDLF